MKNALFTIVLLTLNHMLFSQTGDCINAESVVKKTTFEIEIDEEDNQVDEQLFECEGSGFDFGSEGFYPTHWLSWKVFQSGTLTLTLSRETELYDLDFFIYKVEDAKIPCSSLDPIRCMLAGETFASMSSICLGPTGMNMQNEDLFENPGCMFGNNNFVRFIEAFEGEEYRMVIVDFSSLGSLPIKVDFCGTALLGPDDIICDPVLNTTDELNTSINIFPNPVGETLFIDLSDYTSEVQGDIIDNFGSHILSIQLRNERNEINVDTLPSGPYIFRIRSNEGIVIRRFVKI